MKRVHEEGTLVMIGNTKEEDLGFVITAERALYNGNYESIIIMSILKKEL